MPKRRLISSNINTSKSFNRLTEGAQALMFRMIANADDMGVLPGDPEKLCRLLSMSLKKISRVKDQMNQLIAKRIGAVIEWEGDHFFVFKPETFDEEQRTFLRSRTRSEYMLLGRVDFDSEIRPKVSFLCRSQDCAPMKAESRKLKAESIEGCGESFHGEQGEEREVALIPAREIQGEATVLDTLLDDKRDDALNPHSEKRDRVLKNDFVNVSISEITAYFLERGSSESEAEHFFDHYLSNGCKIAGKSPMRDWKATVRNWLRNDFRKSGPKFGAHNETSLKRIIATHVGNQST